MILWKNWIRLHRQNTCLLAVGVFLFCRKGCERLKIADCLDEKTRKELNRKFKKRGKTSHEKLSERDIEELMGHSHYKRVHGTIRQVK